MPESAKPVLSKSDYTKKGQAANGGIAMALALILAWVLALSGCAVLDKIEESPMTAELITNQITLRLIAGADDPVARAVKVREKAAMIHEGLGNEYTLVELESSVRDQVDWQDYSAADQELLNFAITKAGQAIKELIGDGVVDPQERVTVDTLFRWIDQAAARVR